MVLANANSVHTKRWITSLCNNGVEIVLLDLHQFDTSFYNTLQNIKTYSMGINPKLNNLDNKLSKLAYFAYIKKIKKIISFEKPLILHSFYASSFGLVGALCKFHPFMISVWGSDIYEFPQTSFIAKKILTYNLAKADLIMATSNALAKETNKYTSKKIDVIPFGIDTDIFFKKREKLFFLETDIIIGTIKSLEKVYGIEYLISAFAKLKNKFFNLPLKLMIVGSGSCEKEYKNLTKKLNIQQDVYFTGHVKYSDIVSYYNTIDIFVASSIRESFGVSVLEASACEIPVVVSDTGGLPEVVINKRTGILVKPKDIDGLTDTLEKLVLNKELREKMGNEGRNFVEEKYLWHNNIKNLIKTYQKFLNISK